MNLSFSPPPWRPEYPGRTQIKVQLSDLELQTFVSDGCPGLAVVDIELDSPACFWIDSGHVYFRANWGLWCTVDLSNPTHVAALCSAHCCRVTQSVDNTIRELTAPVYHIGELPGDLFPPETGEEEPSPPDPELRKILAIASLSERIPPDVDALPFKNIVLEGETSDLVLSSDEQAIVFAVYPENEDYVALPCGAEGSLPDQENAIPETRIDQLVRFAGNLKKIESDTEVHIAIIASDDTLESMRTAWKERLEKEHVFLVEYPAFESFQRRHFPARTCDEDDGDVYLEPLIDDEAKKHGIRVLACFRRELAPLEKLIRCNVLQIGNRCAVVVHACMLGDWLADEESFNGEPPMWFSETDHVVSPVHHARKCCDFFARRIPGVVMDAVVVLPTEVTIVNEAEILDCWREGCHVTVVRAGKNLESALPSFRGWLLSVPVESDPPVQIDKATVSGLAEEFAAFLQ